MSDFAPTPTPDRETLRAFLLGTLPDEQTGAVGAWLEADPAHAGELARLDARDSVTEALGRPEPPSPGAEAAAERVIRRLSDPLRAGPSSSDPTSEFPGKADTVLAGLAARGVPDGWPPARLGGYRVVREIGHGGMGYVFEAEDETLARRVAVKLLAPELARRPDATARFLREARAAAAVENDHVVPILHVGEAAGGPYIVMPLLRGESLDRRLRRDEPLPHAEVARIGRDVAAGLAAAHARGLVHRDLKPANVWLDADTGRARVLDFGLARLGDGGDAITDPRALIGTPAFVSPEQIDGKPATPRSDLFSLGATLYECATGRRAFEGPTVTAVLRAVADHHPEPPAALNPDLPPALSDLIVRLLAKDPAGRPGGAAEVAAALGSLSAPVSGGTTPTVAWAGGEAPRSRRGVWVAVGLLLAGIIGVGVWVGTRPRESDAAKEPPGGRSENPGPHPKADPPQPKVDSPAARYKGKVEVQVERVERGNARLLRLNERGALPLRQKDKFRIEGEVDPPAYLYLVWVDPEHDVTPVYPWDAAKGWGSRPAAEQPVGRISLPGNVGNRYTAPAAKPGVATMVLFATAAPLAEPDEVVRGWFEALPDLPLPPGGDRAAVWFDDFAEVKDPLRLRTFGEVGSDDAFARWQGQLQKSLGKRVTFQTAVSFARTGTNK